MATRKDLLKAHNFTTQRLVSALVDRDPDAPRSPLSRITTATFVSVLIGVIALAGSMLIGKLRPGQATDWAKQGQVIQDLDSGNLFIYTQTNKLQPMANITSARLMAATGDNQSPPTVQVRGKKLKSTPRDRRMGIPGAPYELPAPADMQPFPLRSCVTKPSMSQPDERFITVEINNFTPDEQNWAIAVEIPNGDQYVIMQGVAHKLWKPGSGSSPLIEGLPLANVPEAWLKGLPVGQPIEPRRPDLAGQQPERGPKNLMIGQIAQVGATDSPDVRYYIQLESGLARISYLDMRAAQAGRYGNTPVTITESEYAQYATNEQFGTPNLPYEKPVGPKGGSLNSTSVCATYLADDPDHPRISVNVTTPTIPQTSVHPLGNKADVVTMNNMAGALLMNRGINGTEASSFLIYNNKAYPIPDAKSRTALGYDSKNTTIGRVPAGLIALFQMGLEPGLSLSAASIKEMP